MRREQPRLRSRGVAWWAIVALLAACGPARGEPPQPPASAPASGPAPASTGERAPARQPVQCRPPQLVGPSIVSDSDYDNRHGQRVTSFAELPTSPETPLEECGLEAIVFRLATLTCADGANPFGGDMRVAHASRRGNIGPGGRCGALIDVYEVSCPERSYEVHADMYFCSEAAATDWLQ